jgi:peroxiredoxin Q/BCP
MTVDAHDQLEKNFNPVGRIFYSASTMICTPSSRSHEVGRHGDAVQPRPRGQALRHIVPAATVLLAAACGSATPASSVPPGQHAAGEPSIVVTEAFGDPHVGDLAPDFELPDQDGRPVKLSAARGSVVVLAFVASFCPFSKAEQPYLAKLAADYAGRPDVKVIAIGIAEPERGYREYLARMPMALPVLHDEGGAVALRYTPPGAQPQFKDRTQALVTSNLVIDRTGRIRFFTVLDTVRFDATMSHVRRAVDALLAEHTG